MTDPVDTDALRDMGATLTKDGHPFGPRIAAVADEVDRLRAAVESAPHAYDCDAQCRDSLDNVWDSSLPCTCWKADVL